MAAAYCRSAAVGLCFLERSAARVGCRIRFGLTGVYDEDKAMLKPDGSTVKFNSGTNTVTYDFKGTDNTFTVVNSDAIGTNTDGSDYNYVYNNIAGDGSVGTLHLRQTNTNRNDFADVTGFSATTGTIVVNSNLDINAYSAYASVGISAGNDANLTINGNVKMRKDDDSNPWGIITKNVHGNIGPVVLPLWTPPMLTIQVRAGSRQPLLLATPVAVLLLMVMWTWLCVVRR